MYNLPSGKTFAFLKDRELELLCFGPWSVTLHFEGDIRLHIEGGFTHITKENRIKPAPVHFPLIGSQLMQLLMRRITDVKTEQNGTLTLGFTNGDSLVIEGNVSPYESYNINHPDGLLVV